MIFKPRKKMVAVRILPELAEVAVPETALSTAQLAEVVAIGDGNDPALKVGDRVLLDPLDDRMPVGDVAFIGGLSIAAVVD